MSDLIFSVYHKPTAGLQAPRFETLKAARAHAKFLADGYGGVAAISQRCEYGHVVAYEMVCKYSARKGWH